jgi:hypothetical protein
MGQSRGDSSSLTRTKNKRTAFVVLLFFVLVMARRTCPTPQALVAGNVCRFEKQMTDFVRQDKLAAELSEACSSALLPALKKFLYIKTIQI